MKRLTTFFVRLNLILALISLPACFSSGLTSNRSTSVVTDKRLADQTLVAAQAQATIAAIDTHAATQTAVEAEARLQQQYARATEQASALADATVQAQQAIIQQLMVDQSAVNATTQAQQAKASAEQAWLRVTAEAQSIRATATSLAKRQVDDDERRTFDKQNGELTFWVGWAIKIGLGAILLIILFTVIEVLRKRSSVAMVGNTPIAIDGSVFGAMSVTLLLPEPSAATIISNQPMLPANAGTDQFVFHSTNQSRLLESMSEIEFNDRQYWRTRSLRFLQTAMAATKPDSNRIPRYDKMGMKAADWVEVTDAVGQWIDKRERQPTYCLPPYETLSKLHDAILRRQISPLPPELRAQYSRNSGKQETGKQAGTGETGETALKQAVSRLPEVEH